MYHYTVTSFGKVLMLAFISWYDLLDKFAFDTYSCEILSALSGVQ